MSDTPTTVAGIGCREHTPADVIIVIVMTASLRTPHPIEALAVPHFKHAEPGVIAAAASLRLPLLLVSEEALAAAQALCPTRSAAARRATGHASIAEAAALAVTGGSLVMKRITYQGATCAVASSLPA